ncbi:MAG: CvpA family protein [Armatimonadetes bacterium]|nr:CvpA family protein [Armatimonadota bacterium]
MNWVDLAVLVLIGTIAAAEVKRGFGPALFTVVGAFLALKLALWWCAPLSRVLHLSALPGPNTSIVFVLLFVALNLVVAIITYVANPDSFLSAEPFDGALGGICGFVTGWIVSYALYQALGLWGAAKLVGGSLFALEIIHFQTYHRVLALLRHFGEV